MNKKNGNLLEPGLPELTDVGEQRAKAAVACAARAPARECMEHAPHKVAQLRPLLLVRAGLLPQAACGGLSASQSTTALRCLSAAVDTVSKNPSTCQLPSLGIVSW